MEIELFLAVDRFFFFHRSVSVWSRAGECYLAGPLPLLLVVYFIRIVGARSRRFPDREKEPTICVDRWVGARGSLVIPACRRHRLSMTMTEDNNTVAVASTGSRLTALSLHDIYIYFLCHCMGFEVDVQCSV